MMRNIILGLSLVVGSFALYRWRMIPQPSPAIQQWMNRCDHNNDGWISAEEFALIASPHDRFELYDHNKDHRIDARELQSAFLQQNPSWIFQEPL